MNGSNPWDPPLIKEIKSPIKVKATDIEKNNEAFHTRLLVINQPRNILKFDKIEREIQEKRRKQ